MTKRNPHLWPQGAILTVSDERGFLRESSDRRFDLADAVMLNCDTSQRTVDLSISFKGAEPEADLSADLEELIRTDFAEDGYGVTLIVGRRGQPSRFEWGYSCISLGKAAAGEDVKVEPAEDPLPESEEEQLEADDAASGQLLTLAQAKAALSKTLGVPVESIEITIRA